MAFKLKTQDLNKLFDLDNIRNGASIKLLRDWDEINGLQDKLHTNFTRGLTDDPKENEARIKQYGNNALIVTPPKTIWELIVETFEDQMLRILCAAAAISLVLGIITQGLAEGWLEGASILIAVVLIVSVTSGNNYIKEQQFLKLNTVAAAKDVQVRKNSEWKKMSVYDLLVGDIVEVSQGEIITVDGILLEGSEVVTDESSLTGESKEIRKSVPVTYEEDEEANPFLISNSKISSGSGVMLVVAVGVNSFSGQLKAKLSQEKEDTPLQIKLADLADEIGKIGTICAAATFATMLLNYIIYCTKQPNFFEIFFSMGSVHEIIEYFIIGVSIVVVAVPQGLPLSVTIALAYSVGKMREENNLVRYLQACETMGGADNICSDKTGTLTKNQMTVTKIYIEGNVHEIINKGIVHEETCKLLCLSICNNSEAKPRLAKKLGLAKTEQDGNKTECALLETAYEMGFDFERVRRTERIKKKFPFSSALKQMAVVYEDEKKLYTFVKGAPEILIQSCNLILNKNSVPVKLTHELINNLQQQIENFASQSLRTILLTYKQVNSVPESWKDVNKDLVIIGLVGIKDPLRDGIREAVEKCHEGGVTVRMVTGDNKSTAIAIAKEAGILDEDWVEGEDDYTVMEGKAFREFVGFLVTRVDQNNVKKEEVGNPANFKLIDKQLRVLARSSPDDKYLMATGLKNLEHVVAMTGDGGNDAPALKKADIGFAMGITGTDVAKEASGIILLDDNFGSIVTAMKWGRNIFDSIRKFLQFQLTVNFVALVMAFVGGAVLRESPLNPIQMLWVNLIMDTLASLALATQPPSEELLKRKPYSRSDHLITNDMWRFIISQGLFQILILGIILFKGPDIFGIPSSIGVSDWNEESGKHYSIFFNVFVMLQIFNQINARKLKSIQLNVFEAFFNNPLFIVIVIGTIIIQLTLVKYGGKSVKTVELTLKENLLCIILGMSSLLTCLLYKVVLPENLIFSLQGIQIGSFKYYWSKNEDKQAEKDRKFD